MGPVITSVSTNLPLSQQQLATPVMITANQHYYFKRADVEENFNDFPITSRNSEK